MHKLCREIRFTISPFTPALAGGNSYCSKPDCEGMGFFFSLWVELCGKLDAQTGFVINLTDIDKICRSSAVPAADKAVKQCIARGQDISAADIIAMLNDCHQRIRDKFTPAEVVSLAVRINPYRKIKILTEDKDVIYYSEKFEFAAMHKLWNSRLCPEDNFAKFGKCANITGHGHNYIVEVTIKAPDAENLRYGGLQRTVIDNLIEILDHKNLNEDVPYFADVNPTVENITTYAWQCLEGRFGQAKLDEITIWETDRAYCSYRKD